MAECDRISVVIPVYNGEKYIGKCLKSIEEQTYDNIELIVINDGSTDKTFDILKDFEKNSRLSVQIVTKKNAGQAAARNDGMRLASGKYIAFLDSDDYVELDYFEKLHDTAVEYHSDVVTCGYRYVTTSGEVTGEVCVSPFAKVCEYGKAGMFVVWAKLFRTDFLRQSAQEFPEGGKIYEDVPFSLVTKFTGENVMAMAYIGYNYVQHEGSTMSSSRVTSARFPYDKMREAILRTSNDPSVDKERFTFEVLHFFAGFLFLFCRKAKPEDIRKLCAFASEQVGAHLGSYWKNPYLGIFRSKELPLLHRIAIRMFVTVNRMRILTPFTFLITRI